MLQLGPSEQLSRWEEHAALLPAVLTLSLLVPAHQVKWQKAGTFSPDMGLGSIQEPSATPSELALQLQAQQEHPEQGVLGAPTHVWGGRREQWVALAAETAAVGQQLSSYLLCPSWPCIWLEWDCIDRRTPREACVPGSSWDLEALCKALRSSQLCPGCASCSSALSDLLSYRWALGKHLSSHRWNKDLLAYPELLFRAQLLPQLTRSFASGVIQPLRKSCWSNQTWWMFWLSTTVNIPEFPEKASACNSLATTQTHHLTHA